MAKRIIQFPTWQKLPREGHIRSLHFSSLDSNLLAAVCWIRFDDPEVAWFDLRRDAVVDSTFGANRGEDIGTPPSPALSPDQRFLARMANEKGGEAPYLEFLDRAEKNPKKKVRSLTAWPYEEYHGIPEGLSWQCFTALSFTPDGSHLLSLITGGDPEDDAKHLNDLGFYRWSVRSALGNRGPTSGNRRLPDPKFFLAVPQPDVVGKFPKSIALSPDGSLLTAGFWDQRIPIWDLASGKLRTEIRLKKRNLPAAWRLAFSPDGNTLAIADKTVTLHSVADGKPVLTLPPSPKVNLPWLHRSGPCVLDLAYHPSEDLLMTACGDSIVRWWNETTGEDRGRFDWNIGKITAVAFSQDGKLCAAGGENGQVALWDVGG